MVTRRDYDPNAVRAARSVLIELVHALGEYRKQIVLIGGWVPELSIPGSDPPHVGSLDLDLAIDHRNLQEQGYRSILNTLRTCGCEEGEQPFIFLRRVHCGGGKFTVQVDLLAGEYEGTGKSHRHQRIQDVHARKVRGCDLAFHRPIEIAVSGELPNGATDTVHVQVASMTSFLVMKGIALAERIKEKDAYNIYFCVRNFPGGLEGIVVELEPNLSNRLVQEGLLSIARMFDSPNHFGPRAVADFDEVGDPEERERIQRDVFERISFVLDRLNIRPSR